MNTERPGWWHNHGALRKSVSVLLAGVAFLALSAEQSCQADATDGGHLSSETSPEEAREIGKEMVIERFGQDQWEAADQLLQHESGWDPMVENYEGSGACGIPQSWPCEKMTEGEPLGEMTVEEQMEWFLDYVEERYGTPQAAWEFWLADVDINGEDVGNWY